ncbi:hypothetical protein [Actinacidiphila reveromycinica]|uniref:hypothetical protein n=1 Tax=Actinacidiphila reveromycinica TaxID=659352 RepID=UPI001922D328|nr:hypothetical protein [Streptomyces sp. SN-593]
MIDPDPMTGTSSGIRTHFSHLSTIGAKVIESSVSSHSVLLGEILQLEADIGAWESCISMRPESEQIADARRELGFAAYAACCGLYRLAFSGIRTFLELSFAAVYFSANELHRRQWVADRRDFSWSQALDEENGVLSKKFIQEFLRDSVGEASFYAAMAARSYRHCSQFIHGKSAVTKDLPRDMRFSTDALADWAATARNSAQSVLFALYGRYASELIPGDAGVLGATLEHSFLHLKSVRSILGLPVEG